MRVVVLMSTYNGEKYLREQIESIIKQEGDFQLDLLVRDDGSSDNTVAILQEYKEKEFLEWYSGTNLGPADSFLDLMLRCGEYDYYALADQDDVWELCKLEKAANALKEYHGQAALFASNLSLIDGQGALIREKYFQNIKELTFENTLIENYGGVGCTIVYNHKLSEIIKGHEKPKKIVMHDYFLLQTAAIFGKIIYSNETLVRYRQHENNVVGIKTGFKTRVAQWKKNYLSRPVISVTEQLNSILKVYDGEIPVKKAEKIRKVIHYNDCLKNRLLFFVSPIIVTSSRKRALAYRVNILLGKF